MNLTQVRVNLDNSTKEQLDRYLPIRVVVRETPTGYEGLVEESWNMNWSPTHVQIYWSGTAYSILGEHTLDGVADAEHNVGEGGAAYDPLADDCPVDINWKAWLSARDKFGKRNAPFTVEPELVRAVRAVVKKRSGCLIFLNRRSK